MDAAKDGSPTFGAGGDAGMDTISAAMHEAGLFVCEGLGDDE
jgi:hypothetical protein